MKKNVLFKMLLECCQQNKIITLCPKTFFLVFIFYTIFKCWGRCVCFFLFYNDLRSSRKCVFFRLWSRLPSSDLTCTMLPSWHRISCGYCSDILFGENGKYCFAAYWNLNKVIVLLLGSFYGRMRNNTFAKPKCWWLVGLDNLHFGTAINVMLVV